MPTRETLYFLVRKSRLSSGSTAMRGPQLMRIVAPHLSDAMDLKMVNMPSDKVKYIQEIWAASRPSGGVYFVTKGCLSSMSDSTKQILRRKGARLLFDYVDSDLNFAKSVGADVHVCSSYRQAALIRQLQNQKTFADGRIAVILHNPDERLYAFRPDVMNGVSAVYCGSPELTHIPQQLADAVTVLPAETAAAMPSVIAALPRFNFHYCVRHGHLSLPTVVKPFTKGFTAAMCQSNVLVTRDVPDATEILGDDYPYFASGNSDAELADAFAFALGTRDGPEWQHGLSIMRDVAERISGRALAREFRLLVQETA